MDIRKISIFFALAFTAVTIYAGAFEVGLYRQSTKEALDFKVMSFNIRYDNPADGVNAWPNRKDMVAGLILAHEADIVGMQEVLENQLQDLEERLPGFQWFGVGRDDGKSKGEFCPVFYRSERFEVLDSGTFWLSETPEVAGSKGWDAACKRIVTWGKFQEADSRQTFFVFNTHFDHQGKTAREESARLLINRVEEIAGSSPVVVTGDFNCRPDSKPYSILTALDEAFEENHKGLTDAFTACLDGPFGPRWTFHGFTGKGEVENRIDYIFVKNNVRVMRFNTLEDSTAGHFPSDHLPVLAEVRIIPANQ